MIDFNNLTLEQYRELQNYILFTFAKQNSLTIPPTNFSQKEQLFKVASGVQQELTQIQNFIRDESKKLGLREEVYNKIPIPFKLLPKKAQADLRSFLPSNIIITTFTLLDLERIYQNLVGTLFYYYQNSPKFTPNIPTSTIPPPPPPPPPVRKTPPKLPKPPPPPPPPPPKTRPVRIISPYPSPPKNGPINYGPVRIP